MRIEEGKYHKGVDDSGGEEGVSGNEGVPCDVVA